MLYINKRGSHSSLVCTDCNHLFGCPACDHALSIHTHPPKLLCHICGHHENIPLTCSACHGTNLLQVGVGTQQLEQQISFLFPQAQVFRFDFDQMKQKKQKSEAIAHLHSADIIIGTKMITTGFDFKKVGLIGVILLEQELQIPVYNTEEKVYQNIKQLLGR
ncbi:MAG: hypothetical protein H6767_08785 [Candidatus Peribacteria bacterium]|nr:MAG: hypothetical protein H6767_08785 [Candidatus Peribacteria bacterium]